MSNRALKWTLPVVAVAVALWVFLQPRPAPLVESFDLNGQLVNTEQLKGKPYLVNFWATSCVTCVKEMPELIALHQEFSPKGFQTVAVAMSYDRPEFLVRFVQDRSLPFLVVHDIDRSWTSAWGDVEVTPTTFVVDSQGQIYKRYVGEPDFQSLRRWLKSELARAS